MLARQPFRVFLIVLATLVATGPSPDAGRAEAQEKQTSRWTGTLDAGAAKLELHIQIDQDGDQFAGRIFSVSQNNAEIPVSRIEMRDGQLVIEADSVHARFAGRLNEGQTVAEGTWTQLGKEYPLQLQRVESFEAPRLVEFWKGSLRPGTLELKMGLKVFESSDGTLTASMDSYSQGATGIPVNVERDGDSYTFSMETLRMRYEATRNKEGTRLSGTFRQAGLEMPLEMERAEADYEPKWVRPQHPQEPYPYESVDVTFDNADGDVTLAGTLTLPEGGGPFPAAVLISGSGSQDRDETIMGHKPFLVIADYLTRRGIAVLRFDDRGTGESGGREGLASATSEDFARDVEGAVDFLQQQPRVDDKRIGLIGHSEGGLIAPLVASQREDVAFIVSMAGPGVDGAAIVKSQTRAAMQAGGVGEELIEANDRLLDKLFQLIQSGAEISEASLREACAELLAEYENEQVRTVLDAGMASAAAMFSSPWMAWFVQHDPATVWQTVRCPVLAINGEKDLQVLAELNLPAIREALEAGGNPHFEVCRMQGLNHLFQETQGPGLAAEYSQIEQTFSPEALQVIGDWLQGILK
jgi:pimeloyl-ACP methyl ester carboxylesterase